MQFIDSFWFFIIPGTLPNAFILSALIEVGKATVASSGSIKRLISPVTFSF